MAANRRYYKGAGSFRVAPYDGSAGFIEVGNVSEATRTISTTEDSVADYESDVGGTAAYDETVDQVTLDLTCYNFAANMMALANKGTTTDLAAAAVADEPAVAYRGSLIPLRYLPDTGQTVTVESVDGADAVTWTATTVVVLGDYVVPDSANTYYYKAAAAGTTGSSEPTWPTTVGATVVDGGVTWLCVGKIIKTAGTDYTVERAGVLPLDVAGGVEDGRPVRISYSRQAQSVIEMLTAIGSEWVVHFDGINRSDSKQVMFRGHRCRISAADALPAISDKFASYKLKVTVLRDDAITGAGLSKYLHEHWAA